MMMVVVMMIVIFVIVMVMLMMKKKMVVMMMTMVMILLMMNGKIDESCPILPHNYTPCISMYSSYTLVKALGCTQIFIFEKQISSWELLTPDPLQVRLEALRQEHPGKSEEPKIGVFFFLLGWGDVPWDVFQFLGKLLLGWFLIWDLLEELFWV